MSPQATHDARWAAPVREFMSRDLVSVRLDTALIDVQRILGLHEISAVPVVDEQGALRGILSTKDLLRNGRLEMTAPENGVTAPPLRRQAADLMRTAVLTIDERASIGSAGAEMVRHRVHRLIVVRDGRPCAVVSTRDAMQAIALAKLQTPLAEVMTREVQSIDLGLPVDQAVQRLDDADVRGLVVVDGAWPVGVFTHTEALRALALPPSMRTIPVEDMMSYETICLEVSTPLYRVANQVRELRVRRILAVDQRSVRGIATGFDLLRVMTPNR
jgi:CBS domain-containing protein